MSRRVIQQKHYKNLTDPKPLNSSVYIYTDRNQTSLEQSLCLFCCCLAVDSWRLLDTDQVLYGAPAGRWAAGQWTLLLQCAGGSRPELLLQRRAGLRAGAVGESLSESRLHGGAESPGERKPTTHCIALFLLLYVYRVFDNVLSVTIVLLLCQYFLSKYFQMAFSCPWRAHDEWDGLWWISLCAMLTTLFLEFWYLIFWTFFSSELRIYVLD